MLAPLKNFPKGLNVPMLSGFFSFSNYLYKLVFCTKGLNLPMLSGFMCQFFQKYWDGKCFQKILEVWGKNEFNIITCKFAPKKTKQNKQSKKII